MNLAFRYIRQLKAPDGPVWFAAVLMLGASCGTGRSADRIERTAGGITVTLPAVEEDLAPEFLKLAKQFRAGMEKLGPQHTKALTDFLRNEKAKVNSLNRIAAFVGKTEPDKAMKADWEAATKLALRGAEAWGKWESGFDQLHLWSRKEAKIRQRGDLFVFEDVRVKVNKGELQIRPGFLPARIDLEDLPALDQVPNMRLDFVLSYRSGTAIGKIAGNYANALSNLNRKEFSYAHKPVGEIFDAIVQRVTEQALEREILSGKGTAHFREGIAVAFQGSIAEVMETGGRGRYFGRFLRNAKEAEWKTEPRELIERLKNTRLHPQSGDGPVEIEGRRVALAMVLLKLTQPGQHAVGWIREPLEKMDAASFLERVEKLCGDESLESRFRKTCHAVSGQLFTGDSAPGPSGLSQTEKTWPQTKSGAIEIVHSPVLAETAKLAAPLLETILLDARSTLAVPGAIPIGDKHLEMLRTYGLEAKDHSMESWRSVFGDLGKGNIERLRVRLWLEKDLERAQKEGQTIPGIELDPATGETSVTSGISITHHRIPEDADESAPPSMILPLVDSSNSLGPEKQADLIAFKFRGLLDELLDTVRIKMSPERFFFQGIYLIAGEVLITRTISSEDRRWFCAGLAYWIAIQVCEAEFGEGAGWKLFERAPEKLVDQRAMVNLIDWAPAEDEDPDAKYPYERAHYYYATLAIDKALEGKDAAFVREFLGKIRETRRKRVNMGTVYKAFRDTNGGDLKKIAEEITAAPEEKD